MWHDRRFALAAAAAVAVLASAVTGVALTSGGDDGSSTVASADGGEGSGGEGSGGESTSLAERLEKFANTYVTTAAGDPRKGFELLTAEYQQASGGLSGYQSFWGKVEDVRVERVSPDPEAMRVTYIYSYLYEGSRRTETVTLQLTKDGSSYLIDGAESI